MGTMTEWQDVGMNSEEKAQLQAIYDKVVISGETIPTVITSGNGWTEGVTSGTYTFEENIKYGLIVCHCECSKSTNKPNFGATIDNEFISLINQVYHPGSSNYGIACVDIKTYEIKDIPQGAILNWTVSDSANAKDIVLFKIN